ncbi:MAG: P-II family nitrogen regulator [Candidatus Latescibacteria bacterium]|nr:P-II family nitrogen regulator [Candidatus Latescibacterota bacterium]
MKEIKAIIQPFLVTRVVEALKQIEGLPGLTVDRDIRGFGKTQADESRYKIVDDLVEYVPKAKLEIVVPDELAEKVIQTIQTHAHTGNPGDGKIFVVEVAEVIKIRTGERGEKAI